MSYILFEDYLKNQFDLRRQKNARYSLRAFAKRLEIQPSLLSKILRNKYKLTQILIQELGKSLDLSEIEINNFIRINQETVEVQKFSKIEKEEFEAISTWYYFAILRYLDITPVLDSKVLSKYLSVNKGDIEIAIQRMKDLKIIESIGDCRYQRTKDQIMIKPKLLSQMAHRKVIREFLTKADHSVDHVGYAERTHACSVFSIKKSSLPVFQEKISEFILELSKIAQKDKDENDAVYSIVFSLFPLVQITKEN